MHKLLAQTINVNPYFIRLTQDIDAGVMLSYLYYEHSTNDDNEWIPKTQSEWIDAIQLTRTKLEKSRAKLVELGLIDYKRDGLPARPFYRVNHSNIETAIANAFGK